MLYWALCLGALLGGYLVNILYITVFYHRGLTHGAVKLSPWLQRWVVFSGNWVTGLDPKGWSCMHRMHHLYADTPEDPHSPVYGGIFPLMLVQLRSYNRTLSGLLRKDARYTTVVPDLNFSVNWMNRHKLWIVPYAFHLLLGISIGYFFHAWMLGYCYWLGIMSHPIQGWMVNALGHAYGYRNFNTPDQSRNNLFVAWTVFGEGFQNNHHEYPSAARFSVKWWEVDMGYWFCVVLHYLGVIEIASFPAKAKQPRLQTSAI